MESEKKSSSFASDTPEPSRKTVILTVLIGLLLIGVGAYLLLRQMATPAALPLVTERISPTQQPGMFGSIKDALSKSLTLQCEYMEDDMKTTAYIKAGNMRVTIESATPTQNGNVIIKDDTMYYWNGKQGMKMAFDIDAMPQEEDELDPQMPASILDGLEKFRESCKVATISDTMFIVPTDVKFEDQTRMMESMQQMQTTVTPGQTMNEEQMKMIQQQMQQYTPSTTP